MLVSKALLSRIEYLEAENKLLKEVRLRVMTSLLNYTLDLLHSVFIDFFSFLGPCVNELTYWEHTSIPQFVMIHFHM